jgi:hypothetical protein
VKEPGRNKADSMNIVVPRAKSGPKWPSDANVTPAKPPKWIKKVVPNPVTAPVVTRVIARASGSKAAVGGVKKTTTAAPKRRVPPSRMLAVASSVESQESLPHELLPQGLVLDVTTRPERETSLHITSTASAGGASVSNVVAAIAVAFFSWSDC